MIAKLPRSLSNFLAVWALAAFAAAPVQAAKFANQFVEFELPPQWQCNLEGAEWVCQSTNEERKRDAIVVLAAKLKGEQDSLDQYRAYLKQPKAYTSVGGKSVRSEPKYANDIQINAHPWIDSLHMESEIPGFYTRYLATVKEDIGVLVTYSINRAKYQQYLDDFENLVKTLRVFRKPGGINSLGDASKNLFNTTIPKSLSQETVFPSGNVQGGADTPKPKPQEDDSMLYILGIAGAALAFIIWRKRRGSD